MTISSHEGEEKYKRIPIGFFGGIKLSFQRLLPFCTYCRSKRDKLSHAADSMVKEEVKVVKWVQFHRVSEEALKRLFKPDELAKIREEAS